MSARPRVYTGAQVALALLCVGFLALAWKPVHRSIQTILHYPHQIDREEGFILNQALALASGESIYQPIVSEPYLVGNYTPIFPAVYAVGTMISGGGLGTGRGLVLVAALLMAALLGAAVYTLTKQVLPALLAPAMLLCTYDFNDWIVFARVDFPALFFTALGVFLFLFRSDDKRFLIASALALVCAFYTKQSQVLAPVAAVGALALYRQWVPCRVLVAAGVIGGLVLGLALLAITRGQFWLHTVTYNANEMDWGSLGVWLRHLRLFEWPLLLAMAAALVIVVVRLCTSRGESDATRVPLAFVCFYAVFGAASIVTIAKMGSASNYLLDFHFSGLLLLGVATGQLMNLVKESEGRWNFAGPLLFLILLVGIHGTRIHTTWLKHAVFPPPPSALERATLDALVLEIMDAPGDVLSEDPVLLIAAGKRVLYQPFIMARLAQEGHWSPEQFTDRLRRGEFSMIVTEKNLDTEFFYGFTVEMRDAILERYEPRGAVPAHRSQRFVYTLRTSNRDSDG